MTVPHWLHAAAWWVAVGVLAIAMTLVSHHPRAWRLLRPYVAVAFAVGLLSFFGCPPAHSATLRWTAPLYQEATTPLGHRCLLSLVPERVALCLVVRQPVAGIARCVAKLPCVRGQAMAWTVPDSLRGAYFGVTAADSAGNKSCAGNEVWVPAP